MSPKERNARGIFERKVIRKIHNPRTGVIK
jgi:hypothetical protein